MKKLLVLSLVFVASMQGSEVSNKTYKNLGLENHDTLHELDAVIKNSAILGSIELARRKALAWVWFDIRNSSKRTARLKAVTRGALWASHYMHRINKDHVYALTQAHFGPDTRIMVAGVPVITTQDVIEVGYDLAVNYLIQPKELESFKWESDVTSESPITVIAKSYTKKKIYDTVRYYAYKNNVPQAIQDNEWVNNAQATVAFHAPIVAHVLSDAAVETVWNLVNMVLRPMGNYLVSSTIQTK
ncbi:hypothetical protein Noda2021_00020 [Candidatus Dependentiae bacterium Noda2021]|nr:hypothetical protein Noda2021_00020 [Candidatus Dependentiae bacterium Noda2021]